MELKKIYPIERSNAEAAFASDVPEKICDALIRITYHDSEWLWVQEKCISFLSHSNVDVRGLAVCCLGHLARIHHKLSVNKIVPLLEKLKDDSEICGRVQDALDDINMFVNYT